MTAAVPMPVLSAWRRLGIVGKVTVFLTCIAIGGLFSGKSALVQTVKPAFDNLEVATVTRRINVADQYLQSLRHNIEGFARDYGIWDDSYEFIVEPDPAFVEANLNGLTTVGINAVAYVTFDGEVLHSHYLDPESGEPVEALGRLLIQAASAPTLIEYARAQPHFSFFGYFQDRLVALGGSRVVRSDGSGEPSGFLLMAREISVADISEALQTTVRVGPPTTPETEAVTADPDVWHVILPALDAAGDQVASLYFDVPRDITKLSRSTLFAAFVASSLVIMALLVVVGVMITTVVARRLAQIERHIQQVAETGELTPLPPDPNEDELGSLCRSFNKMIAQLHELREHVRSQSYKLGRGEWAAGVVHNVRNALNPVTVIISKVAGQKAPVRFEDLLRAATELGNESCSPIRRRALSEFLVAALNETERSASSRRDDLIAARSLLSETIRILSDQHKAAHEEIPLEATDLLQIVEQNIAMVRFAPWGEISVEVDAESEPVLANRLFLSQVIGNILTNSVEAIAAAGRCPGRIRISVESFQGIDGPVVRLLIADDGIGFEPGSAEALFKPGHSSKKNGLGGLGLHWCANIVTSMNGSMTITSDGPGLGACVTLTLAACGGTVELRRPNPTDELVA